jgi:hypothetical protein
MHHCAWPDECQTACYNPSQDKIRYRFKYGSGFTCRNEAESKRPPHSGLFGATAKTSLTDQINSCKEKSDFGGGIFGGI